MDLELRVVIISANINSTIAVILKKVESLRPSEAEIRIYIFALTRARQNRRFRGVPPTLVRLAFRIIV